MGGFGAKAVESPQRKVLILSAVKYGEGTPAISGTCANFLSIADAGAGDYDFTIVGSPFNVKPEIICTPMAANVVCTVPEDDRGLNSFTVKTFDADDGDPVDADFHVMIIGTQARDLVGP